MYRALKYKAIKLLLFIPLFLFINSLDGFTTEREPITEFAYTNFTTKDGLPSNEIYCVFQDSKGYLWIGTDRGLTKYDGYTFKTYTTEDGLSDNTIFGIAEDSKGQVWFITANSTLCYYSSQEGFQHFENNKLIKDCIIEKMKDPQYIFDGIVIDKSDNIYIYGYNFGYLKIPFKNTNRISNHLNGYNEMVLGGIELVNTYQFQTIITTNCFLLESGFDQPQLNGKKLNKIWVESNVKQWKQRSYFLNDSVFTIGCQVYTIVEDSITRKEYPYNIHPFKVGDQYLVNTITKDYRGKVYLVDDLTDLENRRLLFNKNIRLTPPIKDKNGGYWLGSLSQGLFYFPSLKTQTIDEKANVSILIPSDKGIIYGERNTNFNLYNKNGGYTKIERRVGIEDLSDYMNHSILLSHSIILKEIEVWNNQFELTATPQVKSFITKNDTVFFAKGNSFGLYDKTTNTGHYINVFNKRIVVLEPERGNFMFLGCKDGVYKVDYRRIWDRYGESYYDKLFPYINLDIKPRDLKWISSKNILAIATTGNGILFYKGNQFLKKITFNEGLVSNTVNQLFVDNQERLWVATNGGVNYIEFEENDSIVVKNYIASSRSLLSPNVQQLYILEDSLLYVGTDNGLNEFNISNLESDNSRFFPIEITKSLVNESFPIQHDLTHNENNLEFYFTAVEFNRFGDINYRYRLNGLSDQWVYTKERKATFLQVSPGSYQFELEAQNEKGEWVKSKRDIAFKIHKPYWKTWWFIGGISLIVIILVGSGFYYYISNLQKEKEFIEDKQVLSEELNETRQKALSAQLNPHFVFNSLNSIQNFILTKRTELSSDYLSMFSKLMRFVFENSKKLYVPLSDEIEALRLYLELEQVRHNHKFEYKVSSKKLKTDDVFIPSLLVQPMIENAIWHGLLHKQEDNRLLEVNFSSEDYYLRIEIKDNGVGRSGSTPIPKFIKKQRSSGVELTKQRLDLLNQSTGLKTTFEIVDLFNEKNIPSGTLVVLTIPNNLKP